MSDSVQSTPLPEERPRPFWNVISVVIPLAVLLVGVATILATPFGTGDYAGRLGSGVLLVISVGVACAIGFVAAVVALIRGERWVVLSWVGAMGNGIVVVPILGLAIQN